MRWLPAATLPLVLACTHTVTGTMPGDDDTAPTDDPPASVSDDGDDPSPGAPNPSADGSDDPTPSSLELTGDYCGAVASSAAQCKAGYGAFLHLVVSGASVTGTLCIADGGSCSPLQHGSTDGYEVYFEAPLDDGVGTFQLAPTTEGDLEGTIDVDPYPTESAVLYRIR